MRVDTTEIRVKGKTIIVPSVRINNKDIIITGKLIKIAKIKDEEWLESDPVEDPASLIQEFKQPKAKADILVFSQRFPETRPKYDYYIEWDNVAAVPIKSFDHWFEKQISRSARRSVMKSKKKGILVGLVEFNDELVKGISSIYNETPIRQGKPFWHYGKDLDGVKEVNITYLDRSDFIGAFYNDELIGYMKIVYVEKVARMMQILSKIEHRDKSPTNALIAKAVEICAEKGMSFFTYGNYVYGKTSRSTLIDFKRHNGFEKIDFPKYYVPLNIKGKIALKLHLHHGVNGITGILPEKLITWLTDLRTKFYTR